EAGVLVGLRRDALVGRLLRLLAVLARVRDAGEDHLALALDRGLIRGERADEDPRLVAGPVVAAIGLDDREELLPRDEDLALAFDGPPRRVGHLRLDAVAVVPVGMIGL